MAHPVYLDLEELEIAADVLIEKGESPDIGTAESYKLHVIAQKLKFAAKAARGKPVPPDQVVDE